MTEVAIDQRFYIARAKSYPGCTILAEESILASLKGYLGAQSYTYEGESISNQPNLFPVEIHLFFFDVIAL